MLLHTCLYTKIIYIFFLYKPLLLHIKNIQCSINVLGKIIFRPSDQVGLNTLCILNTAKGNDTPMTSTHHLILHHV